jgi:hypothetical protein
MVLRSGWFFIHEITLGVIGLDSKGWDLLG